MELMIEQPKITTLYMPSKQIFWYNTHTDTAVVVIEDAIALALMRSTIHPDDRPSMIELKE